MKYFRYCAGSLLFIICFAANISKADTHIQNKDPYLTSSKWGISKEEINALRHFSLTEKAGGCERIKEFEIAARNDDAVANFLSGICYGDGINVPISVKTARQYFEKSSDLGLPEGMIELASFFLNGTGGKKDKAKAAEYLNSAVALGNVKAKIALASWLMDGHSLPRDEARAMKLLEELANSGNRVAQNIYANMLLTGKNGQHNDKLAFELLEKSSAQGEITAKLSLAYIYLAGQLVEKNQQKSISLFKQAAATNDPFALYYYGEELMMGLEGKENIETGAQMVKQAGEMGIDKARISYARYLLSLNDNKKKALALRILNDEIENDNSDAMNTLSIIYYSGKIVPQDRAKAIKLLKNSIDKGNDEANTILAATLLKNKDDKESIAEGLKILDEETLKPQSFAKVLYAAILLKGEVTTKNPDQAEKLLLSAANDFDRKAMFMLGTYYFSQETKASKAKAHYWLEIASNFRDYDSMLFYGKILIKERKSFADYEKGLQLINEVALTKTPAGQKARGIQLQINTAKCRRDKNSSECREA